jgi:hypothetical protein
MMTPRRQPNLNRAEPCGVRVEFHKSDVLIFDKARRPLNSVHLCFAIDLAFETIIETETLPSRPDTAAMEAFCRKVLRKVEPTSHDVCICVDRSDGIDWDLIGMRLGLLISQSVPRLHSQKVLGDLRNQVRTRAPVLNQNLQEQS